MHPIRWTFRRRRGHGMTAALVTMMGVALLNGCDGGLDEGEITSAVQAELTSDPAIRAGIIDVATSEGVVTLQGSVRSLLAKERAARVAETVRGVRSVVNLVEVQPSGSLEDDIIEADVVAALYIEPATEEAAILVEVEDGVVTLEGVVDSWTEREMAGRAAKGVRGVEELRNELAIAWASERPDEEIRQEVLAAMRWDVLVDHGLIDVQVDDGRVTLRGVVGSAAEKREARYDAWVAGVEEVNDSALMVERWARDPELRGSKYAAVADEEIEEALESAIRYDPRVHNGDIAIGAENGVVTLEGTVADLGSRRAAETTAHNTVGVVRVENRLEVFPEIELLDDQVAQRVRMALERDPYLDPGSISVAVADGVVSLAGMVQTTFQRAHADEVAARATGVVGVLNNLDVPGERRPLLYDPFVSDHDASLLPWYDYRPYVSQVSDDAIRESIERELFWSPFVEGDDITVEVEEGVATLRGVAGSARELRAATENAYEGGAVWVENELVIVHRETGS